MKSNFTALKVRMLFRVFLFTVIAGIIGFLILNVLIDGVLQEPFAEGFVNISRKAGMSRESALNMYQTLIRNNKQELIIGGFALLMLVFFYVSLSKFTNYLNQVGEAVEEVLDESNEGIILPTELKPLEDKLETIKLTLKQRQYEATEAEQRKNDLVVYLAHDLKTPLTSVIGYLSLLTDEKEISNELRERYTSIALDKAERLEGLINEFFEITRYNIQSVELEKTRINLTFMLEQVADEFYPLFEEKGIVCETDIKPSLFFEGDADKLARVFDNLLRNAINYSYINSTIKISAYKDEGKLIVKFCNQGDVIPERKLNSIFQKFYRLDSARSSKTGGTGLGLAISKEIVELHNGIITAESNKEYTEFKIEFWDINNNTAKFK